MVPAFPENDTCFFLYLVSEASPEPFLYKGYYLELVLTESYGLSEAIRDLKTAFQKYSQWEQELTDGLMKKRSIRYLCRLGQKIFQNPILVHNAEYEVIAVAETDTIRFAYPVREPNTNHMPESLVKDLIFRKDYLETFAYTAPKYWLDDDDKTLSIYMNLFDFSGNYMGRIVIDEIQKFGRGAEDLRIHTSTLKYRLQKIKSMLNLDLFDPDNKLYLGIIFFLLEEKR